MPNASVDTQLVDALQQLGCVPGPVPKCKYHRMLTSCVHTAYSGPIDRSSVLQQHMLRYMRLTIAVGIVYVYVYIYIYMHAYAKTYPRV